MKYLAICFFLLAPIIGRGQTDISFGAGIGTYLMGDLKTYLSYTKANQFPADARITSSFPPYWFYDLKMKTILSNNLLLGGVLSIGSTGGRVFYSDYSATMDYNELIGYASLAVSVGYQMKLKNNYTLQWDLMPGVMFTELEMDATTPMKYTVNHSEIKFDAWNYYIQPTATITKRFGVIGVFAGAGIHITAVPGKLKLKSDNNLFLLQAYNNKPAHADWSGIRVNAGVTLFLKRIKK